MEDAPVAPQRPIDLDYGRFTEANYNHLLGGKPLLPARYAALPDDDRRWAHATTEPTSISATRLTQGRSIKALSGPVVEAQPTLDLIRKAFYMLLVAVTVGILSMSIAPGATAAPLVAGVGMAIMWLGCLGIVVASYVGGLRSGYYLLSPRSSITAMIVFSSLALTAIVGGIEFMVR